MMAEPERALLRSQGGSEGWGSAADVSNMSSRSYRPCFAGVAVHSIPVITTEQLAQGQGSWEDESSRWKAQQQGFVAKEGRSARPGTADTDGAASVAARRRKERTYPELGL